MTASHTIPDIPSLSDHFVKRVEESLAAILPALPGGEPQKVLVALSGGPDSCALLSSLCALAPAGSFNLAACHVNHRLRAAESDQDEEFCRKLCQRWGVELHIRQLESGGRDEAHLRQARYAALAAVAAERGFSSIATGHTLDDQVETVLFRLFRGSSPAGLQAMQPVRPLNQSLSLIRPLLSIERAEVEAFLQRLSLTARSDSSNQANDYTRNFLRNEVIKAIKQRFPSLTNSVERFRQQLSEDEALLQHLAEQARSKVVQTDGSWSCEQLLQLPPSLRRRLVAATLQDFAVEVTSERIAAVLELAAASSAALSLNSFCRARSENGALYFEFISDGADDAPPGDMAPVPIAVPGTTVCKELRLSLQVEELQAPTSHNGFPLATADEALVDLSAAVQPLVVRLRLPGDRIQPFGMAEIVKLKKYLHTHKSTATINRGRAIVVADDEGILWVPGVGISERLRAQDRPTHRLRFIPLP